MKIIRCNFCGYEENDASIFSINRREFIEIRPEEILGVVKHKCSECVQKDLEKDVKTIIEKNLKL